MCLTAAKGSARRGSARVTASGVAGLLACAAGSPAWAQFEAPTLSATAPTAMQGRAAPSFSLSLSTPIMAPTGPGTTPQPLDMGLLWRQPLPSNNHIDITAWRRMTPPQDALSLINKRDPVYGARVEMKLAPARAPNLRDLGFIGLQLDSGARIMLRRKDGNPTLYYRTSF